MTEIKAATTIKTAHGDVLLVEYDSDSPWRINNIAAEHEPALRALLNKRAEPEPTPEKAPPPTVRVFEGSTFWRVARTESGDVSYANYHFGTDAPFSKDDAKKEAYKLAAHLNAVEETKRAWAKHRVVRSIGGWGIVAAPDPSRYKAHIYDWGDATMNGQANRIASQLAKLYDEDAAAHG